MQKFCFIFLDSHGRHQVFFSFALVPPVDWNKNEIAKNLSSPDTFKILKSPIWTTCKRFRAFILPLRCQYFSKICLCWKFQPNRNSTSGDMPTFCFRFPWFAWGVSVIFFIRLGTPCCFKQKINCQKFVKYRPTDNSEISIFNPLEAF